MDKWIHKRDTPKKKKRIKVTIEISLKIIDFRRRGSRYHRGGNMPMKGDSLSTLLTFQRKREEHSS